ncbi:GON-4-like protein [Scyliorhinus torazame]|uniref:GON-4-like protein n=1 Tax=Scyliorhinus torazame TaxID=75743 RepID=UPI003B5B89FA
MPSKTYHQLSVRIKNLSVSRAPDNVIKLFKKRKMLQLMPSPYTAVLPEHRRPAIEREENKLPYWLQRSLPSIRQWFEQSEGQARCDAKGSASRAGADPTSANCELPEGRGPEGSGEPASAPLLIPEGLTLLLKPKVGHLAKKEIRWRKRRPSGGKPVLIHPAVKKVSAKQLGSLLDPKHNARPPPRLIQPAPSVPFIPIAQAPGLASLIIHKPPAWMNAIPFGRKPRTRWPGRSEPKGRRPRPALVPVRLQTAPVILTVPAGVKLVSLTSGCNVIDVPAGQTLRMATMVVSPATFACPLSQPPAGCPANIAGRDAAQTPAERPAAPGDTPLPRGGAPDQRDSKSGVAAPRHGGGGSSREAADRVREAVKESTSPAPDTVGKTCSPPAEGRAVKTEPPEDTEAGPAEGLPETPSAGEREPPEEPGRPPPAGEAGKGALGPDSPSGSPRPAPQSTAGKQQLILGLGQELDVDALQGNPPHAQQQPPGPGAAAENPSPAAWAAAAEGGEEDSPSSPGLAKVGDGQPAENCDRAPIAEEPATSPEDVRAQLDKADKDGQDEEEEDEDFDDLTQDEEDEEVLSSASEESALSVPELQETMEKLTWLASERRLSQEGDSEEENSQEENSEPEEEEESEGLDPRQKEAAGGPREAAEKEMQDARFPTSRRQSNASSCLRGEVGKLLGKGKAACRSRAKRGRRRISKDASKLLLLYDEDILNNDPLREQKDMAFAQAYLTKVREALQDIPGKYEDFLRILYDFETNPDRRTAVDLYGDLCDIIQEWPQLLKDFAAFLLPEQALQCGLFQEQQAFDKSRKFLRQLEICFAENPAHYQKIIKALQSCMVCTVPDMAELKIQVWQLLKGHHHLQDEFSLFFDNLRPPTSRMSDFEEVNWTEDKEYEFDGFEEVALPDLEDEEELQKMTPPRRNKRRRDRQTHEKSLDLKMSKGKDSVSSGAQDVWSPQAGTKDPGKGFELMDDYPEEPRPLGLNSKDGKSHVARASGRNIPRGCRDPHPWRGLQPPADTCCAEEGHRSEVKASPRGNEGAVSPAGSADETWSPASEGESSETQGLEEVHPLPPSPGCCEGPHRGKGGCAGHPETGVRGEERTTDALTAPSPKELSRNVTGHASVKFATAGAQVRFLSCQKLSDLSPIDLQLTLGHRPSADASGQGSEPPRGQAAAIPSPQLWEAWAGAARERVTLSATQAPPLGSCSEDPLHQTDSTGGCTGEEDEQYRQAQAAVCAKNSRLSSTGERVVLWTREADRAILTACRESGANEETFRRVVQRLGGKSLQEVSQRFRELMRLFHTSGDVSTDEEDDAVSSTNPELLADRLVSDEEQE